MFPSGIRGVHSDRLRANAAGDAEITFLGEFSDLRHSLFAYLVDPNGKFVKPRLLWADTSDWIPGSGGTSVDAPLDPGDSIRLSDVYAPGEVAPGQKFGLLVVRNGYQFGSLLDPADEYRLIDVNRGGDASLQSVWLDMRLVNLDEGNAQLGIYNMALTSDPYETTYAEVNRLSYWGQEHFIAHTGKKHLSNVTWLAFEEEVFTRYEDFQDLFLRVDTDPPPRIKVPVDPVPWGDGRRVGEETGDPPLAYVRLDTAGLAGGLGVVAEGEEPGDRAGYAVAQIGDFDGDGFGDVAIGAPLAGEDGRGAVYILFGRDHDIPDEVALRGEGGRSMSVLFGGTAGDRLGISLAAAGDVDGDGYDDLLIGATGLDGAAPDTGGAYLLFGGSRLGAGDIETVAEDRFLRIDGLAAGDETGIAVAGGGDVDGDGFDDVLIGARLAETDYARYSAGVSYLLFGGPDGVTDDLDRLDGSDGVRITGVDRFDQSGRAVAILGDVNGDGYDDLAVGAPDADPDGRSNAGEVYVIYGDDDGFPADLDPATMGNAGFVVEGADPFDFAGFAVAGAGDVNGDGFDDLLIGAYARDTEGGAAAGAAYLVFGSADGHPDGLDLGDLDGSDGFAMFGLSAMSGTGRALAGAGDVNGDGFDDFVVGARYADPEGVGGAGEVYLIYGRPDPFAAVLDLSSLDGADGSLLVGTAGEAYAGFSFGGPGDIDGDGFDDLVIGAPAPPSGDGAGRAFAVFGGPHFGNVDALVGEATAVV